MWCPLLDVDTSSHIATIAFENGLQRTPSDLGGYGATLLLITIIDLTARIVGNTKNLY